MNEKFKITFEGEETKFDTVVSKDIAYKLITQIFSQGSKHATALEEILKSSCSTPKPLIPGSAIPDLMKKQNYRQKEDIVKSFGHDREIVHKSRIRVIIQAIKSFWIAEK